jgi:hypothetical protein
MFRAQLPSYVFNYLKRDVECDRPVQDVVTSMWFWSQDNQIQAQDAKQRDFTALSVFRCGKL